ncbi:MAG TPA: hypothetical protein IAC52_03110 [Candidatus Enteromonas pullicola]|uniref:Uncharacterized protein n=1 Tax=Candidatus Alloenteromonas pullicola TaxID=2840784 RepID=A0A9D1LNQ4_9FIRM|nr:hypothetical protein [Candidatus Enteromonas pullicola]
MFQNSKVHMQKAIPPTSSPLRILFILSVIGMPQAKVTKEMIPPVM